MDFGGGGTAPFSLFAFSLFLLSLELFFCDSVYLHYWFIIYSS